MNNELNDIIEELKIKLADIPEKNNSKEERILKREVIDLQQELLNASLLGMEKLEENIKNKLRYKELQLDSYSNDNIELELGYLIKYIKERYD